MKKLCSREENRISKMPFINYSNDSKAKEEAEKKAAEEKEEAEKKAAEEKAEAEAKVSPSY